MTDPSPTWPNGLMTALVTPLTSDDRVDVSTFHELLDRQIESGVSGVVVAGGTGEYGSLNLDERRTLATEAVGHVAGRVPVVVQTGALATRDAVALSVHAQEAGADAIMTASPFGEPISWSERVRFYEVLTAAVSVPVMIYNTPPSGLLSFDQIQELAQLPHVSAVKDSSGLPELMGDLVDWARGRDFGVYVGLDSLLYDAVRIGASGAVFGAANIIPGPLSAVARHVRDHGATPEATELWRAIRPFLRHMERSPNYVALTKAGLQISGLDVGSVREPYLMPARAEVDELDALYRRVQAAYAESPLSGS